MKAEVFITLIIQIVTSSYIQSQKDTISLDETPGKSDIMAQLGNIVIRRTHSQVN